MRNPEEILEQNYQRYLEINKDMWRRVRNADLVRNWVPFVGQKLAPQAWGPKDLERYNALVNQAKIDITDQIIHIPGHYSLKDLRGKEFDLGQYGFTFTLNFIYKGTPFTSGYNLMESHGLYVTKHEPDYPAMVEITSGSPKFNFHLPERFQIYCGPYRDNDLYSHSREFVWQPELPDEPTSIIYDLGEGGAKKFGGIFHLPLTRATRAIRASDRQYITSD